MGDSSHFLSSYDAPGSVLSSFKAFPEHQAKMSIYTMGMKPLLTKSPSFCFHGNTRAHAQWEDKMGTRAYIQDLPPPHPTTHPISRMTLKHHFRHTGVGASDDKLCFSWMTMKRDVWCGLTCGFPHTEIILKFQPSSRDAGSHPHSLGLSLRPTAHTQMVAGWHSRCVYCGETLQSPCPFRDQAWDLSVIGSETGGSRCCSRT